MGLLGRLLDLELLILFGRLLDYGLVGLLEIMLDLESAHSSRKGIVKQGTSLVHASAVNGPIMFVTLLTCSGVGGTVGASAYNMCYYNLHRPQNPESHSSSYQC